MLAVKTKIVSFHRMGLSIIQRNIRKWLGLRNWTWWKLYVRIKPLLSAARAEDEMRQKLEELEKTVAEMKRLEALTKELEAQNVTILQQKNDLFLSLQAEQVNYGRFQSTIPSSEELFNNGAYHGPISCPVHLGALQTC